MQTNTQQKTDTQYSFSKFTAELILDLDYISVPLYFVYVIYFKCWLVWYPQQFQADDCVTKNNNNALI